MSDTSCQPQSSRPDWRARAHRAIDWLGARRAESWGFFAAGLILGMIFA